MKAQDQPSRSRFRRVITTTTVAAAILVGALGVLPAPQASAASPYYGQLVVQEVTGADFAGTTVGGAGWLGSMATGTNGDVISTGSVVVGPVPSYQGAQTVHVLQVMSFRETDGDHDYVTIGKATVLRFAAGADPRIPQVVSPYRQSTMIPHRTWASDYVSVRYEIHWYATDGAAFSATAVIVPRPDGSDYHCFVSACTATTQGLRL